MTLDFDEFPEVCLAQRVIAKRTLVPSINIEDLLKEYAKVEFVSFPVEIDGLCLDLKVPGRTPTVLVNKHTHRLRQRFTLAHELGHVLLPWHTGMILDEIDYDENSSEEYLFQEAEANRFASELLMPSQWVRSIIANNNSPLDSIFYTARNAEVSIQASAIKVIQNLAPNYVIARINDGVVTWSARSAGTLAAKLTEGRDVSGIDPYPFKCQSWTLQSGESNYHAWHFLSLEDSQLEHIGGDWRKILDEIARDLITISLRMKFKQTVSAVTSSANSMVRTDRRLDTVMTAMVQRLHARATEDPLFEAFVNHPKFNSYCYNRARALAFP